MGEYVTKKNEMKFQSITALKPVVAVVNDAALALNDKVRTLKDSPIQETLAGALGAGAGAAGSFAALVALAGGPLTGGAILHALAVAGGGIAGVLGTGAAVTGIFVLAAPVAVLAAGGVAITASVRRNHLKQEKERLYQEAVKKHNAIILELKKTSKKFKERIEYLSGINILLEKAVKDLATDLGV